MVILNMPSQITHVLVGEAALALAAPETARAVLGGGLAPFFRLGCQGPDIFYHSQRTRPVAVHYGVLAHRRRFGSLLKAMAELWVREDGDPSSPWAAYILGFATHGALDRAAHPFIVFFSGWMDSQRPETRRYRGCHAFLERILDILAWERATGEAVSSFDAERLLLPSEGLPPNFAERLTRSLLRAYPRETEGDVLLRLRMDNALSDTRHFYELTNPARTSRPDENLEAYRYLDAAVGPRSVSVIYPNSLPRSEDWANEGGSPWTHPCQGEIEDTRSYFDLCGEATGEAAHLLGVLLEGLREKTLPSSLGDLAGNGTLNVGDSSGDPARARFSRPLPLPELMEDEFASRMDDARRVSELERGLTREQT